MNRTLQWNTFRSKVVGLLSEVPMGKLQLFKFREMYEKRYHDSIGVSDLYKMKDVVTITEEHSGTFYFFKNIQVDNLLFVWMFVYS